MNLIAVMAPALILIMLIGGCVSQIPQPSGMVTLAPGPDAARHVETTSPAIAVPVLATSVPAADIANNTTRSDVFLTEPLQEYRVGDVLTLNGTTILAAGDTLLVEVISSSFGPAPKTSPGSFSGVSGIATVKKGPPGGPNTWSFSFQTDGFAPDTYLVTISGITINVRDSTTFLLKSRE